MTATRVCAATDVPDGGSIRVKLPDGTPVAVFKVDGAFYAIGDTCSHEEASLSDGELDELTVECPKHGAVFDLATGKNLTLPATKPVPSYAVRTEGNDVILES
ncbi:MAG: bifunctional 3-phenylpropionate/cinnamic acid dioxygenase ferredoxin subunit [Actinomycetota bacterium]